MRTLFRTVVALAATAWLGSPAFAAQPACSDGSPVDLQPSGLDITPDATARRFLEMASFGPDEASVAYLRGMSIDDWISAQFALPRTCHTPLVDALGTPSSRNTRMDVWWDVTLHAPDQLRQRVAFALSEIMVTSDIGGKVSTSAIVPYYDILVRDGLGNFRDLLENVTLSTAMGRWLSMLGNQKPDAASGRRADENYAREVMQLFTIGKYELRRDGTVKINRDGSPKLTYTQEDIEGLSRVLTGWSFVGADETNCGWAPAVWEQPMAPVEACHDTDQKVILDGTIVPAGGSARDDLKIALDTLFNHPNVGAFIGRQLIQKLVTSNPSPEYIKRVTQAFNNNGQGVRGDMQAVVRAVLTDPEALGGITANPNFGKLREPLLAVSQLWRALDGDSRSGHYRFVWTEWALDQAPLGAPSVFNFYSPEFAPSGEIEAAGLVAPEFQMANEASIAVLMNFLQSRVTWYYKTNPGNINEDEILIDLAQFQNQAIDDPAGLVDELDRRLTRGQLPAEFKAEVAAMMPQLWKGNAGTYNWGWQAAGFAIAMIVESPYFLVFQ